MKPHDEDEPVDSFAPSDEPAGVGERQQRARGRLGDIANTMRSAFEAGRRVLSFGEYLDLFASHPARYGRSAPEYVRDMFAFYGTETLDRPWGKLNRFKLFDAPWDSPRPTEARPSSGSNIVPQAIAWKPSPSAPA